MTDKKFTFEVLLETSIRKQVKIEADTPEEAMRIALDQTAGKLQSIAVELRPTWIEESERCETMGELSMQLMGECSRCNTPLLDGSLEDWHKDWKYAYDTDPKNQYLEVCFPCLQSPLAQLAMVAEDE